MRSLEKQKLDFVNGCLFIDLEIANKPDPTIADLRALASLANNHQLAKHDIPDYQRSSCLRQLVNDIPLGTRFLVGHNIIAHDRLFIKLEFPQALILDLTVVDTLYLAPLAYPERPYHKLVKEYKQAPLQKNDPKEDCYLTNQLLTDCIEQLSLKSNQHRGLLDVYRSCLTDSLLAGNGQFLEEVLGGRLINDSQIIERFLALVGEQICLYSAKEKLGKVLSQANQRPTVSYTLAWLLSVSKASIIPHWVRQKYPQTDKLLRSLRGQKCPMNNCSYCSSGHNLNRNLNLWFKFSQFRSEPTTTDGGSLQEELTKARLAKQAFGG